MPDFGTWILKARVVADQSLDFSTISNVVLEQVKSKKLIIWVKKRTFAKPQDS